MRKPGVRFEFGLKVDCDRLVCSRCHSIGGVWTEQDVIVYPKYIDHGIQDLDVECETCARASGRITRIEDKLKKSKGGGNG